MNVYSKYILTFFSLIFSERTFRLKHLSKNLYIGGGNAEPHFVELTKSNIFSDESSRLPKFVRIIVENDAHEKVWKIDRNERLLFFGATTDDRAEAFSVNHLSRDKIMIRSALSKECLEFDEEIERFGLKRCLKGSDRDRQTFLIANDNGDWEGENSRQDDLIGSEDRIVWGVCPACILNGFGSESQGRLFDSIEKSNIREQTEERPPFLTGLQPKP